jgi:hypothetical protein
MTPVVTDVAGDHDSKNESTDGDFGARYISYFFSYSFSVCRGGRCSHSKRSSIASRPSGPQITANRLDQRSAVLQFKQPSSTSTVSLSTASLSTSTTKSNARHEKTAVTGVAPVRSPLQKRCIACSGSRCCFPRSRRREHCSELVCLFLGHRYK